MTSIVIIDKFPLIRYGMCIILKELNAQFTVIEEETVRSLLSNKAQAPVDLIILGLSEHAPIKAIRAIHDLKTVYPGAKILICDDCPLVVSAVSYINAGADGCMTKQTDQMEIARCLGDVLAGKRALSRDIIDSIFTGEPTVAGNYKISAPVRLTEKEYKIASYLTEGKSTSWIAGKLERKPSTISTIKATIFKKFGIENVLQLRDRIGNVVIRQLSQVPPDYLREAGA